GLVPWPRLFQNLRASRETELAERFPLRVVTDWLGNSPNVALAHYLSTTEEHFQRAAEGTAPDSGPALQKVVQYDDVPDGKSDGAAKSAAPALQKAVQHGDA